MSFKDFVTRNIYRNIKSYFAYLLSSTISAALLFSFVMLNLHPDLNLSNTQDYIQTGFTIGCVIAYVFLVFFIFYSVSIFLKRRNNEFGTLFILGASKKQINKLIAIENMIIISLSAFLGIIIGMVFSKIFLALSGYILGYNMLKFYFPIDAIIIIIGSYLIIGIIVSILSSFLVNENKVLELIKGNKKPKKEPKTSIILGVLSFCLICVGYYYSATSTMTNIAKRMVPVTVVVIIGTYFLFSQLSVIILKLIKKNKKMYMNKTTVLWVSNLMYKIKDNTRIFFLISITSAVAFSSIGASYSFWLDKEAEIVESFPQDIFYGTDEVNDEITNYFEKNLSKNNIEYTKIEDQFKSVEEGYYLVSESMYEDLSDNEINISDNEVYLLTFNSNNSNTLSINNNKYKIIDKNIKTVIPSVYSDTYVVNDNVYNEIEGKIIKFIGYNVEDFSDTLEFCEKFKDSNIKLKDNERLVTRSEMYEDYKVAYGVLLFLSIFISLIFFVTTSSFLYNKCYMDVIDDKHKYIQLNKIGLSYKEIKRIGNIEVGVLFLFPYIVAVLHSIFALLALKSAFNLDITGSGFLVMGGFLLVQIIYYFVIKTNYLLDIKKSIN